MQWLQYPCQSNVDNLNNIRHEVGRYFRRKKKEYLKAKIDELETSHKKKGNRDLYRGINDFKNVISLEVIYYGMRMVIWLQTPIVFWPGDGTISLSCSMYMGLLM
jgi:hypothetical protein